MNKTSYSPTNILFMAISGIIGSGWLFAASIGYKHAGMGAMLAWVIGAIIVAIIAFTFSEVCSRIPVTGAGSRVPHFLFGSTVSYSFAWITWMSYLCYAPIEVQATMQYLAIYFPSIVQHNSEILSGTGYAIAVGVLFIFAVINTYSIRWLLKINFFFTIFKIIIPTTVAVVLIGYFYSKGNVHMPPMTMEGFFPHGVDGLIEAIAIGGIIFAYNGFKLVAEMAGNVKNPQKVIPWSIVSCIFICLFIYLLLQYAYIVGINNSTISSAQSHLGPIAAIAKVNNLKFLIPIIYAGAILAPIVAGLVYFNSATISLHSMSKSKYIPKFFGVVNAHGNPIWSILATFIIGALVFSLSDGWEVMVKLMTLLFNLTYVLGPVALIATRSALKLPNHGIILPFGRLWSVIALFFCSIMTYWCGWDNLLLTNIILGIGLIALAIYKLKNRARVHLHFSRSLWLWFYLIGLSIVTMLGQYEGYEVLSNKVACLILLIHAGITLYLASKLTLPKEEIEDSIKEALHH